MEMANNEGLLKVGVDCFINEGDSDQLVESNILLNEINSVDKGVYLAVNVDQLLNAPADNNQESANVNESNECVAILTRASPVSDVLVSNLSDSDSDSEKSIKLFNDYGEPIHVSEYEAHLSNELSPSPPDSGDEEVTFARQKKATSTDEVGNVNANCDVSFILACMRGLGEKLIVIQEQNNEAARNKIVSEQTWFNRMEKAELNNTDTQNMIKTYNMNINETMKLYREDIARGQEASQSNISDLKINLDNVQYSLTNEIAISNTALKVEFLKGQSELRSDMIMSHSTLKGDMKDIKNNMTNIVGDMDHIKGDQSILKGNMTNIVGDIDHIKGDQSILKNDITSIKGDQSVLKCNMNNIKGDLINNQEIVKSNMDRVQSSLEDQMSNYQNIQTQLLTTISTDCHTAMSGVVGQLGVVVRRVESLEYRQDISEMDMDQMKFDLFEEIETRSEQNTKVNTRVDSLQKELTETRVEVLAISANQDIHVRAFGRSIPKLVQNEILPIQNQVDNIGQAVIELARIQNQNEVKIRELEGTVTAHSAQANALNNQAHVLGGDLKKVGSMIPEMIQAAIYQALEQYRAETGTSNFRNPVAPHASSAPLSFQNPAANQVQPPLLYATPSIPLSPLVPDNFETPPPLSQCSPPGGAAAAPRFRSNRSDHIIADMIKRDQKPSFSGDNVSPPIFLREVESFFNLLQISEDLDKLQLFPTFLNGNPAEWWKIVCPQVTSWDMACRLLLDQYFNDYEKRKYKLEWQNLDCSDFANLEEFTLRGLQILNTIKPRYSDQRKCEKLTVKLPEPLRDYLLHRQFTSVQDFLNQIKQAMLFKNFDNSLYFKNTKANVSTKVNNQGYSNGSPGSYPHTINSNSQRPNNNQIPNNNNNSFLNNVNGYNNNANHNNSQNVAINPNFKGNPCNYDPNYRYNQVNRANYGGSPNYKANYNNQRTQPSGQDRGGYNRNSGNINGNKFNGYGRGGGAYPPKGNGSRNPNSGNSSGGAQARPRLSINQVGWAPPQSSPAPPNIKPTPSQKTPPSPPVTQYFNFNFPPEMFQAVAQATFPPPTSLATTSLPVAEEVSKHQYPENA